MNAVYMALADAGIAVRGICATSTAAILVGQCVVDVSGEEEVAGGASLLLSRLSHNGN